MKLKIAFLLLFVSMVSFAQQVLPKRDMNLLIGKTFIIKDDDAAKKDGYFLSFYKDEKLYHPKNMAYKKSIGLEFELVDVIESYFGSKLVLKSEKLGTIYYNFDRYRSRFIFDIVGEFGFPDGYICEKYIDKKGMHTPYDSSFPITLTKHSSGDFGMVLSTSDNGAPVVGKANVQLYLKNGKHIMHEGELNTKVSKNQNTSYYYTISITLTKEDMEQLAESEIETYYIGTFERILADPTDGIYYMEFAKCLLEM